MFNPLPSLIKKSLWTLKEQGVFILIYKIIFFISRHITSFSYSQIIKKAPPLLRATKDVLFINGCFIEYCQRYRVDHQMEQLESNDLSCDKVYYEEIDLDMIKYYSAFVLYRCPITEKLRDFIKRGKDFNKIFFYDLDDLIIDEKYVREIRHLEHLSRDEYDLYMDGVRRYGECLKLCDYAITTTEHLAEELRKYVRKVYVNRNIASDEMLKLSLRAWEKHRKNKKEISNSIYLGYLSGSMTHNADFEVIKEPVKRILQERKNVFLVICGLLQIPEDLMPFRDQIILKKFVNWKILPEIMVQLDINLAPLEDIFFNQCKSENKWTESSLVKVPTIASKMGGFRHQIAQGETGLLCENQDDWYKNICRLIDSKTLRHEIGERAFEYVLKNKISIYTGLGITKFIRGKLKRKVGFIVPPTTPSGGIYVICKHASHLQKNGWDVVLLSDEADPENILDRYGEINVISRVNNNIIAHFDTFVATLWNTVDFARLYPKVKKRIYLIQGFEPDIYDYGDLQRKMANSTYSNSGFKMVAVAPWIQRLLKEDYGQDALYLPNGLDLTLFRYRKRDFSGTIRILIEGSSKYESKKVDECFLITNGLERPKFEIWYLSGDRGPKDWYEHDRYLSMIPHDRVGEIYGECHILLKASKLESFSYPPLEMIATGGISIVVENEGNSQYLKNGYNCLFYKSGDLENARNLIYQVCREEGLRRHLIENGIRTAQERSWDHYESKIIAAYEDC